MKQNWINRNKDSKFLVTKRLSFNINQILFWCLISYISIYNNLGSEGFYNVAHMCNNKYAVEWALQVGANGVEMDLNFKEDGTPDKFTHSHICDCICKCPL